MILPSCVILSLLFSVCSILQDTKLARSVMSTTHAAYMVLLAVSITAGLSRNLHESLEFSAVYFVMDVILLFITPMSRGKLVTLMLHHIASLCSIVLFLRLDLDEYVAVPFLVTELSTLFLNVLGKRNPLAFVVFVAVRLGAFPVLCLWHLGPQTPSFVIESAVFLSALNVIWTWQLALRYLPQRPFVCECPPYRPAPAAPAAAPVQEQVPAQ